MAQQESGTTTTKDRVALLRDYAHRCVRLARSCADRNTSHALEAMSVEFMEKAAELEATLSIPPADTDNAG